MQETIMTGQFESLQKYVENLAYPALLLDGELKICYKNNFCINRILPLRMGSNIKNYITSSDYRRIGQLKNGETIRISMEITSLYWAVAYKYNDFCIIGLRTLTTALQNRISELMNLNYNFTEALLCQIKIITANNNETGVSELIKKKSNRIIRAQKHINEFLRIVNGTKEIQARLQNISKIIDIIIFSLRDMLRPLGLQLIYNNTETLQDRCVLLCEPDFNAILSLMLYLSIVISQSGKIQIDVNEINGKIYITMITDSVLPEKTAKYICNGNFEENSFSSSDGWLYFELLLIQKMCEYYLWDLKMSAPGFDYSHMQFSLTIPLIDDIDSSMVVRSDESVEEIKGLLAIELADLLDKNK